MHSQSWKKWVFTGGLAAAFSLTSLLGGSTVAQAKPDENHHISSGDHHDKGKKDEYYREKGKFDKEHHVDAKDHHIVVSDHKPVWQDGVPRGDHKGWSHSKYWKGKHKGQYKTKKLHSKLKYRWVKKHGHWHKEYYRVWY